MRPTTASGGGQPLQNITIAFRCKVGASFSLPLSHLLSLPLRQQGVGSYGARCLRASNPFASGRPRNALLAGSSEACGPGAWPACASKHPVQDR